MKKLAFRAHEHKYAARSIIILSYLLLNLTALFLGDIFHSLNVTFSPLLFLSAFLMTITGWMMYPSKSRKKEYKNYFVRQKSADLVLISATFLFIFYVGNALNQPSNLFRNSVQAISVIHPAKSTHINSSPEQNTHISKKSLRKKFRLEIKNIRKAYKDSTKSQKTLYIVLAVIAALALLYGLAAVACGISCSGSEAIAIVVFVAGLGGIVFGLVKLIQRITRGKPKV